jgi:hypothetical protein
MKLFAARLAQFRETPPRFGITNRTNQFLRAALIESSWNVVRKDPALLMKYKEYCKRMNKNKAIIRIAKHLLREYSMY